MWRGRLDAPEAMATAPMSPFRRPLWQAALWCGWGGWGSLFVGLGCAQGGPWRSCCVVVRSRSRALRRGRLDSLRPSVLESTRCVCVCFLGHPLLGFAQPRGRCVLATPLFLSRRLAALAFSWWRASAPSLCCSLLHRPVLGVALFFSRCFWRLWPPLGATSFCSRCPWRPWPPLGSAPLLLRCVCGLGPLLVLRPSSRAARRP